MAKNLVEVVQNLFIPFLLLASISSFLGELNITHKNPKRYSLKILIPVLIGLAILVSVLREKRIIKYNQIKNIQFLSLAIFLGLLFFITNLIITKKRNTIFEIINSCLAITFIIFHFLYKFPPTFSLPFHFVGMDDTYFSTMFLLKCVGFFTGLLFCTLTSLAFYKIISRSASKFKNISFLVLYLVSSFIAFVNIVGIINSYYRRKIKIPLALRKKLPELIKAEYYIFFVALILLLIISICFFVYHLKIHGEYTNSAEKRKLKAYSRNNRRTALFLLALTIFTWLCMTTIKKKASAIVELSPPESFEQVQNKILILLEQISDGHLHRFTWTSSSGKQVRFIVVQKKGMNFGVGFDACEVCGNAGYYERKNEVICNRCDVVMNKSTIGLKGGCNPIPLNYKIEDASLIILTEDLEKNANLF